MVSAHQYFVLGDKRDDSLDSRIFGAVPEKLVVGKVICCTADDMGSD
jgi:signal peptidase I